MHNIIYIFLSLLIYLQVYANTSVNQDVKPFETDVCTSSPNGTWGHCCIEHDIAYWRGGTSQERENADLRLRWCMNSSGGPGQLYYDFVRTAGWAYWGKAWCDTFADLNKDEREQVEAEFRVWENLGYPNNFNFRVAESYTCFFPLSDQERQALDHEFAKFKVTTIYKIYRSEYFEVVGEEPLY